MQTDTSKQCNVQTRSEADLYVIKHECLFVDMFPVNRQQVLFNTLLFNNEV